MAALAATASASAYAQSRYPVVMVDPQAVLQTDDFKSLGNDVRFYFTGSPTPSVKMQMENVVIDSSTRRAMGGQENACQYVLLGILHDMRERAKKVGANAVINLVSFYGKATPADPTKLECYRGAEVRGRITLKGDFALVDQ